MTCTAREAVLPKGAAVKVNGVTIPRSAIAGEVQNHPAPTPAKAWLSATRSLVVRELLLQEARRLGIRPQPLSDSAGRRETDDEALIRSVVEQEVTTPAPDEQSCRRYYESNKKAFRSAVIYEAAHILFAARGDDRAAFERARRDACAALATLTADPALFEQLAKAHSACPSAEFRGNLGQITAGQTTPEFEAAIDALAVGAITQQPVATRYGFHIIRLDRRIEGRDLPYELVAGRIADYLRESVTRRATAQFIARLVSRSEIVGISLSDAAAHRVN
jgi:peptidyl-prolyl cis-trans isomerase C